jgi:hypothetical protein
MKSRVSTAGEGIKQQKRVIMARGAETVVHVSIAQ